MLKAVECIRRPSSRRGGVGARERAGFTLLELVIAIGVMTAMAGVALDLLISANDKTAFRKTAERMERARTLLLDHARSTVSERYGDDLPTNDGLLMLFTGATDADKPDNPGNNLKNLQQYSGLAGLPSDSNDDLYFDGWGNPIYYIRPHQSGGSAAQATAYLVSAGPDRVLVFDEASVTLAASDDDLVYQVSAIKIYDEEANARAEDINLALAKRREDTGALLGSDADSPGVNSFSEIYLGLSGSSPLGIVVDPSGISSTGASAPYLPNAHRYQQSPWNVSASSALGFQSKGNVYPVAQVEALRP